MANVNGFLLVLKLKLVCALFYFMLMGVKTFQIGGPIGPQGNRLEVLGPQDTVWHSGYADATSKSL